MHIPNPPADIYENIPTRGDTILAENTTTYQIDHIDYSNGINVYLVGASFPNKGYPTPEAIWSLNLVKKTIIESIKILTLPQFWLFIPLFLILPKRKFIVSIVERFNRVAWGALSPYIFKLEYMTPVARETYKLICIFLDNLGVHDESTHRTCAKILSHIIEYDTAYRYRLQDLCSETSRQRLIDNPRQELKKLIKLFSDREKDRAVRKKFYILSKVLIALFRSSKVKYAFIEAIRSSEWKNMQYDLGDAYWCMMREDYNYMGQTDEERRNMLSLMGYTVPQSYEIRMEK